MRNLLAALWETHLRQLPGAYGLIRRLFGLERPLIPAHVYASGKKLNLGCGMAYLPGYVNVDGLEELNPDIVARVDELDFAADCEYDLVRASHILEHFPLERVPALLSEWRRVLKPGGYLVVCCPDFLRLRWRTILKPSALNPCSPRFKPGWMRGLFAGDLPAEFRHESVFTERSLRQLPEAAGFEVVGRQNFFVEHPFTLNVEDDSCTFMSINLVAQKPTIQ